MRPALPGVLYEMFALPGVMYENLALITGHCMEYTLACIRCYYYDDGLEIYIYASLETRVGYLGTATIEVVTRAGKFT